MNIQELKRKLEENEIPVNAYSLDGSLPMSSGYVLDREGKYWIAYLFEKGDRNGITKFEKESQACSYIYDALLAYYKPNKAGRFIEKVEAPKEVIYLPDRSKNDI